MTDLHAQRLGGVCPDHSTMQALFASTSMDSLLEVLLAACLSICCNCGSSAVRVDCGGKGAAATSLQAACGRTQQHLWCR